MSTTVIPDIYRHTARKSTVSRKSKNTSLEQSIFDTIQCDIKLEKDDISEQDQSLIILPENEIEQTDDGIIYDILEQIKNQIGESNPRRTISTDVHNTMDSMMNKFHESVNTTDNQSLSITHDRMSIDSEQQSSILSQSQNDDDIVEIGVSTINIHPQSCTCQCHQPTSNSPNEYYLFEQALRNARQEQQQEQSLNNNRLIQILKVQHDELMNFYQRQLYINKTDREQQTIQINQHDSQIQTDLATIQKSNNHVNGTHSTPKPIGPTGTVPRPFNNFLTPIRTTGPSLQQLIPCLTTTTTATTNTITNKTATMKKTTSTSHDLVDLTEDDEDNANRLSAQKTVPIRPQQSPIIVSSPTMTAMTRIQPTNPPVQALPLRPLPEQNSCDHTIARPQLSISQDNTTVRLTWNLPSTTMESIQNYEIYAYKQNTSAATSDWKKIGTVKSMRLPMAVTLKEFQPNSHYAFAVRAISINSNIGPFCEPKTIFTGCTSVPPLNAPM